MENKFDLALNSEEYRFSLEFLVFQEEGLFIAYCPSLDLSTSGNSFNDAVGNFYEMFQLYLESCIETGTLMEDLVAHGWEATSDTIAPPSFSALVFKPEMKRIVDGHFGYEKVVTSARIPVHS